MLLVLFSKFAFLYYVLALICEYTTRYGIFEVEKFGNKKVLSFAKALSWLLIGLNVIYAFSTQWWAFIGLLLVDSIIFALVDNLVKPIIKKYLISQGDNYNKRTFSSLIKNI